jgi:(2Fe-2S) ferredoxin
MPRFERHVFICTNVRPPGNPKGCCSARGSEAVREAFKKGIAERGLRGRVRANAAGCLDACELGPSVVIYPDEVWYGGVRVEDVEEIIERHLLRGEVVERLRIPDEAWARLRELRAKTP